METFDSKQTKWEGLWWHPETNCFTSASFNLSKIKKFKGTVRLVVRKNRYYNKRENGRPNYMFSIKDAKADSASDIEVVESEADYVIEDLIEEIEENTGCRLYTKQEVEKALESQYHDALSGYQHSADYYLG